MKKRSTVHIQKARTVPNLHTLLRQDANSSLSIPTPVVPNRRP
ncbi:hypothetical protein [Desulfosporosinus sp.]|nr:hypothetical protein [Desulfosporosinus sp.]